MRRVRVDAGERLKLKLVYVVLEAQYQSALDEAVRNLNANNDQARRRSRDARIIIYISFSASRAHRAATPPRAQVCVEMVGYLLEELRDAKNLELFKKDISDANIFIGSLIFIEELADKIVEVVGPASDRLDACLIFPSMPAVMRLNKLGSFSMSQASRTSRAETAASRPLALRPAQRKPQPCAPPPCCAPAPAPQHSPAPLHIASAPAAFSTSALATCTPHPPSPLRSRHPQHPCPPHPTHPQLGQSKSMMAEFMRNARKNNDNFEEGLLQLVRTLPKVLKYLPAEKAQDARNFVLSLQYWTGGDAGNLQNMILNVAKAYVPAAKTLPLSFDEPWVYPDTGIWHPMAPEMFEDIEEYLNWYDRRKDVSIPKDAPVIGLVLQRSHLVTGDDAHYEGVVMALEAKGARVVPVFAGGLDFSVPGEWTRGG